MSIPLKVRILTERLLGLPRLYVYGVLRYRSGNLYVVYNLDFRLQSTCYC